VLVPFRALRVETAEVEEAAVMVGVRPMIPSGDEEVLVAESVVVFAEAEEERLVPDDKETGDVVVAEESEAVEVTSVEV